VRDVDFPRTADGFLHATVLEPRLQGLANPRPPTRCASTPTGSRWGRPGWRAPGWRCRPIRRSSRLPRRGGGGRSR
jgi:hypothetical protein